MTPEENKEIVHRATDAFNELDRESFDPCYADEVVVHGRRDERRMDHDEHWEEVLSMFEVVPDLHATTEAMIAEDDRVFVRWTYAGTPAAEIRGVEPSGERVEWAKWSEYRLEDGAIAEAWQLSDRLHLYDTIGVIEVPEGPGTTTTAVPSQITTRDDHDNTGKS